ncbi:MAG TPA: exo-alpha-sialidase [Sedimentisphaerales bacterium]|nr:exo-alpha-sialidase [Sedimentisphaerales bacterium]
MGKKTIWMVTGLLIVGAVASLSAAAKVDGAGRPGLVGQRFGEANLTNVKNAEVIDSLEHLWTENDDRGGSWSARWRGYIVGPWTGQITFHVVTNKRVRIEIDGKERIRIPGEVDPDGVFEFLQSQTGHMERSAAMPMVKGQQYPITITFVLEEGPYGYLSVKWSWEGQEPTLVPRENLLHTVEQESDVNSQPASTVDRSGFVTVPVQHVLVYGKPGRFAGWPANDGLWSWGDEILVGFHEGTYEKVKALSNAHSLNRSQPRRDLLARSLDGGETWTIEDPDNYAGDGRKPKPCPGNINFLSPNFAMHCRGDKFRISYDRGRTWQGPYKLPDIGKKLSARTDYIVKGPKECLFFLSAEEERVQALFQDRAFCARTTDGGKTISFVSWMTAEPISVRSVMPSTVRVSENHLVSALRRRLDVHVEDDVDVSRDWIDVYQSKDGGRTWEFLNKAADTETDDANEEERNGNPASLIRLKDGRLCVTYGYRERPYGIRAKLSVDNGKTWGQEIHLRDDGCTWDLGYTRTFQRTDGQLVTVYYYATAEKPEQHIVATIWDANEAK